MTLQRLGDYLLLGRINHGGMADVYLAKSFQGTANPVVALKAVRAGIEEDPTAVEMFVGEAKLSVLLTHDNIARTLELGSTENTHYIVMEHVSGRDLHAVILRANEQGIDLPLHVVLSLVAKMLEGLDYAHRKSDFRGVSLHIVHRDISPHNVILSYDGEVKLIDFGIARATQHMNIAEPTTLQGKYGYMAPEQAQGKSTDFRADIFSAGVVLYELITQRRLFTGASDVSVLEKVRHAEIYPPRMLLPKLPLDIEDILLCALSRVPAQRFQSAAEMQEAITASMLRHFGSPSQREVAHLMRSLFAEQYQDDLKALERAGEIRDMPADVPELNQRVPGVRAPGSIVSKAQPDKEAARPEPTQIVRQRTLVAGESSCDRLQSIHDISSIEDDADDAREDTEKTLYPPLLEPVNPTVLLTAYRKKPRKEVVIIGVSLAVALLIIATTWVATRPPAGSYGELMMVTVPNGADVRVDGVWLGRTPYNSGDLLTGPHRVEFSLKGYTTHARVVQVRAGSQTSVHVLLGKHRRVSP